MKYKIAAILSETPLSRIPFIDKWIDDQFDLMESKHIFTALDEMGGVEGLLEDIEANSDKHQIMTQEMWEEVDQRVEGGINILGGYSTPMTHKERQEWWAVVRTR